MYHPGVLGGLFSFLGQVNERVEAGEIPIAPDYRLNLLVVKAVEFMNRIHECIQQTVSFLTEARRWRRLIFHDVARPDMAQHC
jgi:hypothetical protein